MKNLEQYKLSDNYFIYKTKYTGKYTKEDFLLRNLQNEKLYFKKSFKTENSLDIFLECPEFKTVDMQVFNLLEDVEKISLDRVAKSCWIYIQKPDFKMHWMHTHEFLESTNRTKLRTQWTYVFYIQIPEDLPEGEGDIIFKTEDNKEHRFVPKEKDILIFPGDLPHIAMPCQSAQKDRVVYASNINFDADVVNSGKEKIRFEEYY